MRKGETEWKEDEMGIYRENVETKRREAVDKREREKGNREKKKQYIERNFKKRIGKRI